MNNFLQNEMVYLQNKGVKAVKIHYTKDIVPCEKFLAALDYT